MSSSASKQGGGSTCWLTEEGGGPLRRRLRILRGGSGRVSGSGTCGPGSSPGKAEGGGSALRGECGGVSRSKEKSSPRENEGASHSAIGCKGRK